MSDPVSNWVLHDYLQVNGGAERLVTTLVRGMPDWGLAVSGIYPEFSSSAELTGVHCRVVAEWARRFPRIPRALLAFGAGTRITDGAKRVVYSGVYAPLDVKHQVAGLKVLYCHTPPRFAFDWQERYLRRYPGVTRPLLKLLIETYRESYLEALRAMDLVVTNSNHVRRRLFELTGVDSSVIYPPIATRQFCFTGQSGYYLSVARLEPAKRVDRIIRAFLSMPDLQLIVTSGGSEFERLKAIANGAPNIHFTHWVSDSTLAYLMGQAIATLYIPEDEDFGMSAVESMSAGKPVIGVNEGGLAETVIDCKTGFLLEADPTTESIQDAIKKMTPKVAMSMQYACQHRAAEFSTERFLEGFQRLLDLQIY